KSLKINPDHYWTHYDRGQCLCTLGRTKEGMAEFDKCIALNPDKYSAYEKRASQYGSLGQWDKAARDFTVCVEGVKMPEDKRMRLRQDRAYAFEQIKQYQKAIDDYTYILEKDRLDDDILLCRGRDYMHFGQVDKAMADFKKSIAMAADNDEAHQWLGKS